MTIPAKMRAVQLVGHGGPEMLELREVAVPEVRRGEVLVRVAAAAVASEKLAASSAERRVRRR